jgi:hypothetical protein
MTVADDNPEPFSPEDLKLLATPDAEIRREASVCSFDQKKLAKRIRTGEHWQQLLQAHLYYDHVVTCILTEELKNPDAINVKRMGFYQKLRLIRAMGLLPEKLTVVIESINSLRNRIAHELDFEIDENQVQALRALIAPSPFPEGEAPLKFNEMLFAALLRIEDIRQHHSARRRATRKAFLNARRVLHNMDVEYQQ